MAERMESLKYGAYPKFDIHQFGKKFPWAWELISKNIGIDDELRVTHPVSTERYTICVSQLKGFLLVIIVKKACN